jgi:hypothetical protein
MAVFYVGSALPVRAQVPEWSLAAQQRLLGGPDAQRSLALQQQLVQQAEQALAAGDTAAAQQAFDRAAVMVHAPAVEMGQVRADMQAGDYRRALTFASHAAGSHRNVPGGTALYAWLLHLGGQGVYAQRLLGDALARAPDDAALLETRAQIGSAWPQLQPVLLEPPLRTAPHPTGAMPPAGARLAGTALLAGDGRNALAPAALVPPGSQLWLRNGMGQTVGATARPSSGDGRLLLLQLDAPLPVVPGLVASARPPFAGSPGYTVEHGQAAVAQAAWPVLRQGFFARPLAGGGELPLGIDTPAGPRGGPVFDAFGDLAGIAVATPGGPDLLIPAARIGQELGLPAGPQPDGPRARAAVDAVYEAALRITLQLLVLD